MTTSWLLNAVSLFLIMAGVLLIFLYLWKSPRFADEWLGPGGRDAYAKHRRLLIVAALLLGAWFVLQYVALII